MDSSTPSRGRVLTVWEPENKEFWEREGAAIARRNLWISAPALMLAFIVWQMWSVITLNLPGLGFKFSDDPKVNEDLLFWLAAAPSLSGATLRIFYSFMIPLVGGRRWTAISTASLLIPVIGMGIAVQDKTTSYSTFMILALLCGFGSGNFSSSMANIGYFYPKAHKGAALGFNAGFGNLGVSVVQFVAPRVVKIALFGALLGAALPFTVKKGLTSTTTEIWQQNAPFIWVPFIVLFTVLAWFFMNDIASAKASLRAQLVIFREPHNWLMCILYLGTFGSFIGYSAGFPLFLKNVFPNEPIANYVWAGAFTGAIIRPVGGWLSDKVGGAIVTFWNFLVMALAVLGVLFFLPKTTGGLSLPFGPHEGSFPACFAVFVVLFLTTGIGNGSTFRMIPTIFSTLKTREAAHGTDEQRAAAQREGVLLGSAVVGFSAAIGAYGGFLVPRSVAMSNRITHGPEAALWAFAAYYLICAAITWYFYSRKNAPMPC
ncbi:MAG: MFS transporter [Polyangiaceae bacterium]|nr:MFS transporter [Polyangiaceae bacterium]